MSAENSSTHPAPAAKSSSMVFIGGVALGLVIGLFVGAVGVPIFESKMGSGAKVTNDPHSTPTRRATPAERNAQPGDTDPSATPQTNPETKPDEKPAEKPADNPAGKKTEDGGGR